MREQSQYFRTRLFRDDPTHEIENSFFLKQIGIRCVCVSQFKLLRSYHASPITTLVGDNDDSEPSLMSVLNNILFAHACLASRSARVEEQSTEKDNALRNKTVRRLHVTKRLDLRERNKTGIGIIMLRC